MRDILYRQRIKSNKTNINGDFHYWGYMDDGFIGPMGKNEAVGDSEQYTGLRDKNGVKIFEGDIMQYHGDDAVREVKWEQSTCSFCCFGRLCQFHLDSDDGSGHLLVIGNIHENPELINQ